MENCTKMGMDCRQWKFSLLKEQQQKKKEFSWQWKKKLQEAHLRKIYGKSRKLALRNKKRFKTCEVIEWLSVITNFAGISQWFKIVNENLVIFQRWKSHSHLYQDYSHGASIVSCEKKEMTTWRWLRKVRVKAASQKSLDASKILQIISHKNSYLFSKKNSRALIDSRIVDGSLKWGGIVKLYCDFLSRSLNFPLPPWWTQAIAHMLHIFSSLIMPSLDNFYDNKIISMKIFQLRYF